MQTSHALTHTDTRASAVAVRWPALGILAFGLVVLYCVGFSTLSQAHNATHDTRHASGFPCH
jgi:cobalt transporter subunit CbtB